MKISAVAMFLLARTYAKQMGLQFWTMKDQLTAIKLLLTDAKTYLK